jgi:H+/Cl- antiporter ClcA
MDLSELARNFHELWQHKPGAVVLTLLGLVVFLFLVVDAWRHKRRHKGPPPHH